MQNTLRVSGIPGTVVIVRSVGHADVNVRIPRENENLAILHAGAELNSLDSTDFTVPAGCRVTIHTRWGGDILVCIPQKENPISGPQGIVVNAERGSADELPAPREVAQLMVSHPAAESPVQADLPQYSDELAEGLEPQRKKTKTVEPGRMMSTESRAQLTARLEVTRDAVRQWSWDYVRMQQEYINLIGTTHCPYCPNVLCAACPHFNAEMVKQWNSERGCKSKAMAMTYDLLRKEITGVITTRRDPASANTFMGIARFIVPAANLAEFNRGAMPAWHHLDKNSAQYKTAVESWRFLGWTSAQNADGVVMFVFDRGFRDAKLLTIHGKPSEHTWTAARVLATSKAMDAEPDYFGEGKRFPLSRRTQTVMANLGAAGGE